MDATKTTEKKVIDGYLEFFSETGTEGGYWMFMDQNFISAKGTKDEHWAYEGLHRLKDGDRLEILSPNNPDNIIWSGDITIIPSQSLNDHICGYRVHGKFKDADNELLFSYFIHSFPAKLYKTN